MMSYDVTIGIPVYRAVDYIEQTMLSALNQTYPSVEFLVLDDCGEDGSMAIVEKIKANHPRGNDVRILHNDHNLGVGASRNRIIDETHGQYLYFLDSDDIIEPYTIQSLINLMFQYKADVVYGSLDRIDKVDNTPTQAYILPNLTMLSKNDFAMYAFKHYKSFQISVCNCLMDMTFLRSHQLRFLHTAFWEDLAFTYEMATKVCRAVFLSDITYHYLCRPGSLSHYQDREKLEKSEIEKNIQTIDYLKEKSRALLDRPYLPYLCKNLEMDSFYIVSHIMKHASRIEPLFTNHEIQKILHHPLSLLEIIKFRHLMLPNIVLCLLGCLPVFLLNSSIWLIGKVKKLYK